MAVVSPADRVFPRQGFTPKITATMTRLSQAVAYAAGDIIANSQTAALVTPLIFDLGASSGQIIGARCVVAAASGTVVIPKFDLLLFRPATSIPFAAAGYPADNAALNVSAAAMAELVAVIPFSDTGWRNQAGGATAAGPALWQSVAASPLWSAINLAALNVQYLYGILQAQNAWNPGAVDNLFTFDLGVAGD